MSYNYLLIKEDQNIVINTQRNTLSSTQEDTYLDLIDELEYMDDPASWFVKKEHSSLDG